MVHMHQYTSLRKFILSVFYPYRSYMYGIALIGVYSAIHGAIQPYVLKILLDNAVATINSPNFFASTFLPALLLIILGAVFAFIWGLYNYFILKSLPNIKADIIKMTTHRLRGQSFEYFQNKLGGALSAKISDLTNNLQELVNSTFNISRQALTIIIAIGMSYVVNPYFALVFFITSIGFIFMAYYCAKSIQPYSGRFAESRSQNSGLIVDCFANIANVMMFARSKYEEKLLNTSSDDMITKDQLMQRKNMINALILSAISSALQIMSIALLLYFGSIGVVTVGDFAFIFILSITVIDQIWFLTENLLSIGEKVGICRRALDTIYTDYQHTPALSGKKIHVRSGEIVFKDLTFNYRNGKVFFSKLNVRVQGKKKIGLVGYSGGGKSSFVNLITRLYDAQGGDILIDGQSIYDVSKESLREHISFIPQDPSLFHRSLLDNIRYGDLNATDEQVIDAAKKAHAHEFISNLSDGYHTLVGERGVKLSGGQRQRIAIARAILKNAPILILDEATSALDSVTEEYIQESLYLAMQDKTVIVIAHRLSTVLAMNEIWVFDKGVIIEQGPHQELLKLGGFYKKLWDVQRGHSFI
ncbi:MAG: ABC transporter ATP-binding protein [Flavobacteriales bacterium]|nr:ABC transporter ATP-binding protein [Flavobacteriales bacterium]